MAENQKELFVRIEKGGTSCSGCIVTMAQETCNRGRYKVTSEHNTSGNRLCSCSVGEFNVNQFFRIMAPEEKVQYLLEK